jgi:acyl carrier protein
MEWQQLADIERAVAEIWKEFLPAGDVDVDDDFLELGGTSLGLIGVVMRMEERFGLPLDTSIVLDGATVACLAKSVQRLQQAAPVAQQAMRASD